MKATKPAEPNAALFKKLRLFTLILLLLIITEPCVFNGAMGLQVEPELGLRIDTLTQEGHKKLIIDLYSYKVTFVIAS